MIDLHSHTNESDGTFSPAELIDEARRVGVSTLAITDHDTFSGYDQALLHASQARVELLCGIEISTKLNGQSIHVLGYFLQPDFPPDSPLASFRGWLLAVQASRRARNARLVERLNQLGLDISLDEVEASGRGMTGRPHFARIMMDKGYVSSIQQAFDEYLQESAKGYVQRDEPQFSEVVQRIRTAGGIASLAHPVRVKGDVASILPDLCRMGMNAIEAYHSDHSPDDTRMFLDLARQHGMLVTGGSDFHGTVKPGLALGTGRAGNVQIPDDLVDRLRACV